MKQLYQALTSISLAEENSRGLKYDLGITLLSSLTIGILASFAFTLVVLLITSLGS